MRMISIFAAVSSFLLLLGGCKKDANPVVVIPPEKDSTGIKKDDRSGMKYLQTPTFVIGFPVSLNESDNAILNLKKRLQTLSGLMPEKGLKLITGDTIWVFTDKRDNKYIPANEEHAFRGSIFIGNKTAFNSYSDTLLLWTYVAELVYDRYLSGNDRDQLDNIYAVNKDDKYKLVYRFDGIKLLKDKVSNSPATKSAPAYLGEILKSCYAQNNYYPFVYTELERFDPAGKEWVTNVFGNREAPADPNGITLPPADFTQWIQILNGVASTREVPLDLWYSKFVKAVSKDERHYIPILASRFVSDSAILQAKYIVETMISQLPDYALEWMEANHYRLGIIGAHENVTDLPETRAMPIWWPGTNWDTRGRGYGATIHLPLMTCGEENLVYLPGTPFANRYPKESIMVHEFAHNIDHGLRAGSKPGTEGKQFEEELMAAFANAKELKLWENTYSMENEAEYWAEGLQAWYNTCRMVVPSPEGSFTLKYRTQLLAYDPQLYQLIEKYFAKEDLKGYHFDYE